MRTFEIADRADTFYAKPGQIRAVILEDPPLFAARAKWLGDQWSIGDYAGLMRALPTELPADMLA